MGKEEGERKGRKAYGGRVWVSREGGKEWLNTICSETNNLFDIF